MVDIHGKPEEEPVAYEGLVSPAWLVAHAMNTCDTENKYISRLDIRCGLILQ